MCTAITLNSESFYFGRSMDIEEGFGERIVVTPQRFPLSFKFLGVLSEHRAIMGMATVVDGYPLYADAFNEAGLCMAGLHFPDNAYYFPSPRTGKCNLCSFELIPFILSRCASVSEAQTVLKKITLIGLPFNQSTPATPLHWIVADKTGALVVEPMSDGLHIYKNPFGVLTNNPPFPFHQTNISRYLSISPDYKPSGIFSDIPPLSFGLGAMGLPGDYSSPSRFVKAAYLVKTAQIAQDSDEEAVAAHFFRLLSATAVPRGAVLAEDKRPHFTYYSCCINADAQIYYHQRHNSLSITARVMTHTDKTGKDLI